MLKKGQVVRVDKIARTITPSSAVSYHERGIKSARTRGFTTGPLLPSEELKALREGISTYSVELADNLVNAYYRNNGSMRRACIETGVKYSAALRWRKQVKPFGDTLDEIDTFVREHAHDQYMDRVLDADERNPAWKIFYLKNHDPRYYDKRAANKITIEISDTLMRRDVVDGVVMKPLALPADIDETGFKPIMATEADTAEVS